MDLGPSAPAAPAPKGKGKPQKSHVLDLEGHVDVGSLLEVLIIKTEPIGCGFVHLFEEVLHLLIAQDSAKREGILQDITSPSGQASK